MVLFHSGVPSVSGGFAGVDVFFVISGYLITSQLLVLEPRGARALLVEFYARRVRRILPALTVVVLATLVLGWVLLLPFGERQELAKSALATALFASNVFFWTRPNDYFAGPSELQPLLHTWSISIEEQFYVLWPVAFLGLARLGHPRVRLWIVGVGTLLSFAACAWISRDNAFTAFYGLPTRAWEIGVGAILALASRTGGGAWAGDLPPAPPARAWVGNPPPATSASNALGVVGMAAIVSSFLVLSTESTFPGYLAALPVLGTAFVIHSGIHSREGLACRALSAPALVAIGKASYAWYLWHWPLISIARAMDLGERDLARDLSLAVVALALAALTTRFVEMPIRERRVSAFARDGRALAGGALLSLATVGLAALLLGTSRAEFERTMGPALPPARACLEQYTGEPFVATQACTLAAGQRGTLFLVGDSYADHWAPAIAAWGGRHDVRALHRSLSSCPVVLAPHFFGQGERCERFSAIVLEEIRAAARAGGRVGVVISNKWVNYAGEAGDPRALAFRAAWAKTLEALAAMDVRVLVIGPTPRFPYSVPECLARRTEPECRLPRARFEQEAAPIRDVLAASCAGECRQWSPVERFCDAAWCYPARDGKLAFTDKGHLSRYAAEAAVPALDAHLRWLLR